LKANYPHKIREWFEDKDGYRIDLKRGWIGAMVKDGRALARATSICSRAATGISADPAGGIPRYGVTRRRRQ